MEHGKARLDSFPGRGIALEAAIQTVVVRRVARAADVDLGLVAKQIMTPPLYPLFDPVPPHFYPLLSACFVEPLNPSTTQRGNGIACLRTQQVVSLQPQTMAPLPLEKEQTRDPHQTSTLSTWLRTVAWTPEPC